MATSVLSTPNLSGNWQIQSAATAPGTTTPTTGVLLLGSLTSNGSAVSGTFRLANLSSASCGTALQQVVTLSGSIDANRNLTLTSTAFSGSVVTIALAVPPVLTSFGTGTIAITGGSCAFASAPAIAAQVASVTATYAGSVTASTLFGTPSIPTGTISLALTQAATSNADGQFNVTGSLQFTGGGCSSTTALTGTVSGTELTLASTPPQPLALSTVQVNAVTLPTATQLLAFDAIFENGPCNTGFSAFSAYTGTLNHN